MNASWFVLLMGVFFVIGRGVGGWLGRTPKFDEASFSIALFSAIAAVMLWANGLN